MALAQYELLTAGLSVKDESFSFVFIFGGSPFNPYKNPDLSFSKVVLQQK